MERLRDNIEKHLYEICLFPSRHVGSPGIKATADYIEQTFRSYGYTDVIREPFTTVGWRFGSMLFCDLDNGCQTVPGAVPCFFSQSTEVTDVPLWLGDAELNVLGKNDVRGRLCIVEFFSEPGDIRGRNEIAEELDRLGAAGAVFISDPTYHTPCAASTKIQRSPNLKTLGTAAVAEEGAYYLARNRQHRFKLFIDADTFPHQSHNVVAIRPGTGPKRAVFGAHFDTAPLTQGAFDNASGVVCVLEMARLLKNQLPEWTFEFAAFDAEEYCPEGNLPGGSGAYVKTHKDHKWEYFMNFDSIGTYFGKEFVHVGRGDLLPEFESIYPKAPFKNGGDDRSFDSVGVPTLWFNAHEKFKDFHTALDSLETLETKRIAGCVEEAVRVTGIISAGIISKEKLT